MSGRSPPLYCTLKLITMHSHQSYPIITTVVIHSYEYYSTTIDNSTIETYRNRGLGKIVKCTLLLLFLTFSALVANPKKLLYTVANPARGLLNGKKKKKKKVWQHPSSPPPRAARSEKNKKIEITRRIHMSCLGAMKVGVTQVRCRQRDA